MSTVTSSAGEAERVTVRRTDWADAAEIERLVRPAAAAVFGRLDVVRLLEKANLAVTLSTSKSEVLAHASFSDHPSEELVDQACWETLLQSHVNAEKFTPMNTLFLRLFVARPGFSIGGANEIVRTVFNAVVELEHICLLTPYRGSLEAALEKIFEPMMSVTEEVQYSAYVCHRHSHCPRLHVRRARVEDHDDITHIFAEQITPLEESHGPYFLSELIETQDEENHTAVCESEGAVVGFVSVSGQMDLKLLNLCFELGAFEGLRKTDPAHQEEAQPLEEENLVIDVQESSEAKEPAQGELTGEEESGDEPTDISQPELIIDFSIESSMKDTVDSSEDSEPDGPPNAFCIQLFTMEKKFEMRSADFLPYLFELFPDRDFCVISVPKLTPDFPLLQSFIRVAPRDTSLFPQELYLCHRWGLLRTLEVRVAVSSDIPAIQSLTGSLSQRESVSKDLDLFLQARKDPDGTALQAFVAQVEGRVIGLIIIRDEEDIEFIRANFDIERFMYFSHHQREEHGRLCHFLLNPVFQHHTKYIFKEVLRLAHKSCFHFLLHPPHYSHKNISCQSLTTVLNLVVPVSRRRQIIYPLEELGINTPSQQLTEQQNRYPYVKQSTGPLLPEVIEHLVVKKQMDGWWQMAVNVYAGF